MCITPPKGEGKVSAPRQTSAVQIYGHKFMSSSASDWMMMTRMSSSTWLMRENHRMNISWKLVNSKCSFLLVAPQLLSLASFDSAVVRDGAGFGASILFFCFDTCWCNFISIDGGAWLKRSYQVLTCVSDKLSWFATSTRSATDKYFWHRNFLSRKASCEWVNAVLRRLFRFMAPVLLPSNAANGGDSCCVWCMLE